jgi:signal transduction histidine kinase
MERLAQGAKEARDQIATSLAVSFGALARVLLSRDVRVYACSGERHAEGLDALASSLLAPVSEPIVRKPAERSRSTGEQLYAGPSMRLADFIHKHAEDILVEWVAFARTCGSVGASMDFGALRDHAAEMLEVIVADLRTPQSAEQQTAKSKGKAPIVLGTPDTAAETHGSGRAESGFSMGQMVSEYRALRASVIRLWTKENGTLTGDDIEDLMRFNEALDQALAESTTRYMENFDRTKEMFVAILGHDLRSPLEAIAHSARYLLMSPESTEATEATARIVRSTKRLTAMADQLLDFTRSRLGSGIPVTRMPSDFARLVGNTVEELAVAWPGREIQYQASGDLHGSWDEGRIAQMVSNLVSNAVQHGTADTPVRLHLTGDAQSVALSVHNFGPAIPDGAMRTLFSPFKRLSASDSAAHSHQLGLGLYIVERIVAAHNGDIRVTSTKEHGTQFLVRLPRGA